MSTANAPANDAWRQPSEPNPTTVPARQIPDSATARKNLQQTGVVMKTPNPPDNESPDNEGRGNEGRRNEASPVVGGGDEICPQATLSQSLVRHRRRTPRERYIAFFFFTFAYTAAAIVATGAIIVAWNKWY